MPTTSTGWSWRAGHHTLRWDLRDDQAAVVRDSDGAAVWRGGLVPSFWLRLTDGRTVCVKPAVDLGASRCGEGGCELRLTFTAEDRGADAGDEAADDAAAGDEADAADDDVTDDRNAALGTGRLVVQGAPSGVQVTRLEVDWSEPAPALIGLHFGAAPLTAEQQTMAPTLEHPWWPDWRAEGFCVPGARSAPLQSFFRSWDLGHATLPLGSFGPSLGTPYAAAFPRPLLAAGMGGDAGWLVAGVGELPAAALTFEIRSSAGCLQHLHREDLWGTPGGRRVWTDPLWVTWADDAWDAYRAYFELFDLPHREVRTGSGTETRTETRPESRTEAAPEHQVSHWNSWGDFRFGAYDLRPLAHRVADEHGVRLLCVDDGWERRDGSGRADDETFPDFDAEIGAMKAAGLEVGLWLPVGWVADPDAAGLKADDLLCGRDGRPRRTSWDMSVGAGRHYFCVDPSSPRARDFLRRRVRTMIERYDPQLLKLDFGYGLPSPHVAVTRDPALRGERTAEELIRVITETARALRPGITIQYYSPHPLFRRHVDLITLDDLGDAGSDEAGGHGQWSVWAALAATSGVALCASSGYDWDSDADVLLNTAVIGAPGAVLPTRLPDGTPVPLSLVARRRALARWHRRRTTWSPLWLNSRKGRIGQEPRPRCWGRLEQVGAGELLTALALREDGDDVGEVLDVGEVGGDGEVGAWASLRGMRWDGRWALIAQDDRDVFGSRTLVCVAFEGGRLRLPRDTRPTSVVAVFVDGERPVTGWSWVGRGSDGDGSGGSNVGGVADITVPASWIDQGLMGVVVHAD